MLHLVCLTLLAGCCAGTAVEADGPPADEAEAGAASEGGLSPIWVFLVGVFVCMVLLQWLAAVVISYAPGYCYLAFYPARLRVVMAGRYGPNPTIGQLKETRNLMQAGVTVRYRYVSSGSWFIHVWREAHGASFGRLCEVLTDDFKVGTTALYLPVITFFTYMHRATRLLLLLLAASQMSLLWGGLLAVGWYCLRNTEIMAGAAVVLAALVFVTQRFSLTSVALVVAVWGGIQYLGKLTASTLLKRWWRRRKFERPPLKGFPAGVGPSGRGPHQFRFPNMNNNVTAVDFREDISLPREARDRFIQATGLKGTSTHESGNSHATAAMLSRYVRWLLPRIHADEYFIEIGGTWKGWGCRPTGIAVQPKFLETDAANLIQYTERPGSGQQVVEDYLATNCGAVGQDVEGYDPGLELLGLAGAVVVMVHVYDIPIKALLAFASNNHSKQVYVTMHCCPDFFTENEGVLPWSQMTWRHDENGRTQFFFPGTTGPIYDHSTLLSYEHFTTGFVCTRPGEWWVSDIYRQFLDLYMVRWTKVDVEPMRQEKRELMVTKPQQAVNLPMVTTKWGGLAQMAVKAFATLRPFEEYCHNAKDAGRVHTTFRALADNLERNRGVQVAHVNYDQVIDIWNAEQVKRELEARAVADVSGWDWLAMVGLADDKAFHKELAIEALKVFKRQPRTRVDLELLDHHSPYLPPIKAQPPVKRHIYMSQMGVPGELLIPQKRVDALNVRNLVYLAAHGGSMAEQLCYALTGRMSGYGVVLPLGDVARGGSVLLAAGNGLLPTEAVYLMARHEVVFVVLGAGDEIGHWYGSFGDRMVVVVLDPAEDRVYRIAYSSALVNTRLMRHLNVSWRAMEDEPDWLPVGTPRTYVFNERAPAVAAVLRTAHYQAKSAKANQDETRLRYAALAAGVEVHDIDFIDEVVDYVNDMAIVEFKDPVQAYDLMHVVEESGLPPPHTLPDGAHNMERLLAAATAVATS